jgi:hypothetical protein
MTVRVAAGFYCKPQKVVSPAGIRCCSLAGAHLLLLLATQVGLPMAAPAGSRLAPFKSSSIQDSACGTPLCCGPLLFC